MSDMKPCPCCGSQNIATRNWWNSLYETRYFAECYDCGCLVGFMADPSGWVGAAYDTEAEAIEAWNTRYERTCIVLEEFGDDYVCDACGEVLRSGYDDPFEAIPLERFKYCFGCGAKVVSE